MLQKIGARWIVRGPVDATVAPMKTALTLTTVVLLVVGPSPLAQAKNLVFNGSFEGPTIADATYAQLSTNTFAQWRSDGNTFEFWADGLSVDGSLPTYSADGRQNLEIRGGGTAVWQTLTTVPNETYVFSFSHTPRATVHSVLTVFIDSSVVAILDEDGSNLRSFRWQNVTTRFTATSTTTTIRF